MILRGIARLGEPFAEKRERDRRTRLRVRFGVGQIVGNGEALAVPAGARAARNIQLAAHDVRKERAAGIQQRAIVRQPSDVRHGDIEIERAHRVSHRLRLLPHGLVRLIVCPVHDGVHFLFPRSALIEKEFGERKVALLARVFVKPHEGKLDLGMSARRKASVPAHVKALIDIVRILLHGGQ